MTDTSYQGAIFEHSYAQPVFTRRINGGCRFAREHSVEAFSRQHNSSEECCPQRARSLAVLKSPSPVHSTAGVQSHVLRVIGRARRQSEATCR